jgi:hypothetical protein
VHLEHGPADRGRIIERVGRPPRGEQQRAQRVRAPHEAGDPRGPIGVVEVARQLCQMLRHLGADLRRRLLHRRLVEVVEPHVPSEFGQVLLASLGGGGEAVETGTPVGADDRRQRDPVLEPTLQDGAHHRAELAEPGERTEQPHQRRLEFRGVFEIVDPVPPERRPEAGPVVLGQTGAVGVDPLHERDEVLLGVLHVGSGCVGIGFRHGPVQGAEVGVDVEQAVLARHQRGVGRVGDLGQPALLGEQTPHRLRGEVEPEQVLTEWSVDAVARLAGEVGALLQPTQIDGSAVRAAAWPARVDGRIRTIGVPRSTWAFGAMATASTSPSNGAVTVVSIFIDSSTAIGLPAVTCCPGSTSAATTSAGHRPARQPRPPG